MKKLSYLECNILANEIFSNFFSFSSCIKDCFKLAIPLFQTSKFDILLFKQYENEGEFYLDFYCRNSFFINR